MAVVTVVPIRFLWLVHVGLLIGLLATETGRGVRRRLGGVAAI